MLVLLLSACQLRQEIRFNTDGSGTVSGTLGIDKKCALPSEHCNDQAERLLKGEGPVANAEADAESLPFDVRIEPFEGPDGTETGYTLSFDFSSVEDLERKLAAETANGVSQTSPFAFHDMTFENEGDRSTFAARVRLPTHEEGLDVVSFAVVLPGAGRTNNA